MDKFKTNVPEIDSENEILFRAANYLEAAGNAPGITAAEFHSVLLAHNIDVGHEDFGKLAFAAIAIETMLEMSSEYEEEETIH
jgi:hypothetical protein